MLITSGSQRVKLSSHILYLVWVTGLNYHLRGKKLDFLEIFHNLQLVKVTCKVKQFRKNFRIFISCLSKTE